MNEIHLTPVVKNLLILNVAVFVIFNLVMPNVAYQYSDLMVLYEPVVPWFQGGFSEFKPYQVVTNFFAHGGIMHIVLNMYALVAIGSAVEMVFRERKFLEFYLFCGLFSSVMLALFDPARVPVVGASGAISGLLAAFAIYYPEARLGLLFIPIQFKARDFVLGFAGISALLFLISIKEPAAGGGVSHFGHLMGILGGWLFLNLQKIIGRFRK